MTSGLFFSIIAVALGVFSAIFTDFSIKIIVIALGAAAIVKGVYDLVKLRKVLKDDSVFKRAVLIRSLISIVVGIVAVALPMVFFKTAETCVHILLYVLGSYFIFCALGGFLMVRRLNNADISSKVYKSETVIYLLIAILLFLLAAIGIKSILRVSGIILAVCGVIGGIYSWHNRSQVLTPDSVADVSDDEVKEDVVKENEEKNEE